MHSIRKNLSAYLVMCSVFAIILSAIFVNLTINKEFNKYVENNQNKRNQRIVDYFKEVYKRDGKWTENSGIELMNEAYMSNYCLSLLDQDKRIMWAMSPHDIKSKMHMELMDEQDKGIYKTTEFPIEVDGKIVGYAGIGQYSSILLSEQDINFKISINKSIGAGIIMTAIITIVISIIISKQFSKPIKNISDISVHLSEGNYEIYSLEKSNIREIENLRLSINNLGSKLKNQKLLRKRLVSDITHEIRTPLNVLQNNLEAMIDGIYEITPERLITLDEEVIRFGKLLNNLDVLKEYESVDLIIHKKRFSLKEIIQGVIEDFSIAAKGKNIDLNFNVDEDSEYIILGDYDKLKQVFINLLSNSIKFSKEKGKIDINLKEDSNFIIASISDNGIGINNQDIPFIFERLYRGDKSRNEIQGYGIGLTIVKRILDLHEVKIDVQSEENIGTKFTMYFRHIQKNNKSICQPIFHHASSVNCNNKLN